MMYPSFAFDEVQDFYCGNSSKSALSYWLPLWVIISVLVVTENHLYGYSDLSVQFLEKP
jgi:hypothetical protein